MRPSFPHLGIENWPHLPLPSSLRADLLHELDELLLQAMAFERDKRPADCAVFEELCQAIMKTHSLTINDKDIARWVEGELRHLGPAYSGGSAAFGRSPPVSAHCRSSFQVTGLATGTIGHHVGAAARPSRVTCAVCSTVREYGVAPIGT